MYSIMSSVQIKITGVSEVRGIKKPKRKKQGKRLVKKKGISELKKKPEFFTTQFTQRPTYIERPSPVVTQPAIDYRPMFDKLMLQQLLLQNKGQDFREQENLGTTRLAKNQNTGMTIQEVMEDEEKTKLQELNREALEKATIEQAKRIEAEESKGEIMGMKQRVKDMENVSKQVLSSLGIPAQTLKDLKKQTKKQPKKNLVVKGGL